MSRERHKILIVKLGYSETLVPEVRQTCSLGDVLRTTAILHLFKDDHVTWLTDAAAVPLLKGNPHIDTILTFDLLNVLRLESERFDKVVNLEKVPGLCAMVHRISAWAHYGFRFDPETGQAKAYDRAFEALSVATREELKRLNDRPWVELLFRMLGAEWQGERFMLGYQPKTDVQYDVGFNVHVGTLRPVKAWPIEHWAKLERMLDGKLTLTHQQHLDNLEGYMDWIHSCRVLVTNDSLGLFLALALGKRVLALFGPTPSADMAPNENLRILTPPGDRDCLPCCRATCARNDPCMQYITPETVYEALMEWGTGG